MQITPTTALLPYIKHYLFLDSKSDEISKLRLFSDGNTGVVFTFNNQFISNIISENNFQYLPQSFVYGQISDFKDLYIKGNCSFIIVVFHPFGINKLLSIPAFELKNNIISFDDILGKEVLSLYQNLIDKTLLSDKLALLNSYFIQLANPKNKSNQYVLQSSLQYIVQNNGEYSINQIAKNVGYSERQIERIFNECVGLNPKKFAGIVRLHHFLNQIKKYSTTKTLTELAFESGYADQSHLIKEFKKLTGITPSQYLNDYNQLAINFMKLK